MSVRVNLFKLALITFVAVSLIVFGDTAGKLLTAQGVAPGLVAKQALDEAIAKHGRKMADTENYPASRRVVSVDVWRAEFFKMRIESGVKEPSIKKDFSRQAPALEASNLVGCYSGMIWFVHDEDRQDI